MHKSLVLVTMMVLTAAAASSATGGTKGVPEATAAGAPVTCIPLTHIRSTQVHDDRTIDFHLRNGQVYRNVLPHACASLGFEQRFSYRTSLTQLCSTDFITVLYQTPGLQPGASCGLGKFQPVTLAKRRTSAK